MRTLNRAVLAVRAVSAVFATAALLAGMDVVRGLAVACIGEKAALLAGMDRVPEGSAGSSLLKSCTGVPRSDSRVAPHSHGCSWTASLEVPLVPDAPPKAEWSQRPGIRILTPDLSILAALARRLS